MENLAFCLKNLDFFQTWAIQAVNREMFSRIISQDNFIARLRQILWVCGPSRQSSESAGPNKQSGLKRLENLLWVDYVPHSLRRLLQSRTASLRVDLSPLLRWEALGLPHPSQARRSAQFGRFSLCVGRFPESHANNPQVGRSLVRRGETGNFNRLAIEERAENLLQISGEMA